MVTWPIDSTADIPDTDEGYWNSGRKRVCGFMKKDNAFCAVIRPIPKCDNLLDAKWAWSSTDFI